MEEEIIFYGHPNIRAIHEKTIELTKAKDITLRGDCIIGVNANKACIDLSNTIKNKLRENNSLIRISLIVDKYIYSFFGYGNSFLIIADKHDIVIRKSEFVCPRTMAIRCNKASSDIPKDLVQLLKDPKTKGILHINIE